jgi:hypothetical protein
MTPQTVRPTGELAGTLLFVKPSPNASLGSRFMPESLGPVCSGVRAYREKGWRSAPDRSAPEQARSAQWFGLSRVGFDRDLHR